MVERALRAISKPIRKVANRLKTILGANSETVSLYVIPIGCDIPPGL